MNKVIKEGYYVKVFKGVDDKDTILTFCANGTDNRYKSRKLLKEKQIELWGDETVETREEIEGHFEMSFYDNHKRVKKVDRYFNTVFYNFYNIWGQQVKEGIVIKFDFENNLVYINDRKFKVDRDREYTYKFLKTKIKAVDGIEGFYKFLVDAMHVDSPFNGSFYGVLEKAIAA